MGNRIDVRSDLDMKGGQIHNGNVVVYPDSADTAIASKAYVDEYSSGYRSIWGSLTASGFSRRLLGGMDGYYTRVDITPEMRALIENRYFSGSGKSLGRLYSLEDDADAYIAISEAGGTGLSDIYAIRISITTAYLKGVVSAVTLGVVTSPTYLESGRQPETLYGVEAVLDMKVVRFPGNKSGFLHNDGRGALSWERLEEVSGPHSDSDLRGMMTSGGLVPGRRYALSYRYPNEACGPDGSREKTYAEETLILTASGPYSFMREAYSPDYPNDYIEFDMSAIRRSSLLPSPGAYGAPFTESLMDVSGYSSEGTAAVTLFWSGGEMTRYEEWMGDGLVAAFEFTCAITSGQTAQVSMEPVFSVLAGTTHEWDVVRMGVGQTALPYGAAGGGRTYQLEGGARYRVYYRFSRSAEWSEAIPEGFIIRCPWVSHTRGRVIQTGLVVRRASQDRKTDCGYDFRNHRTRRYTTYQGGARGLGVVPSVLDISKVVGRAYPAYSGAYDRDISLAPGVGFSTLAADVVLKGTSVIRRAGEIGRGLFGGGVISMRTSSAATTTVRYSIMVSSFLGARLALSMVASGGGVQRLVRTIGTGDTTLQLDYNMSAGVWSDLIVEYDDPAAPADYLVIKEIKVDKAVTVRVNTNPIPMGSRVMPVDGTWSDGTSSGIMLQPFLHDGGRSVYMKVSDAHKKMRIGVYVEQAGATFSVHDASALDGGYVQLPGTAVLVQGWNYIEVLRPNPNRFYRAVISEGTMKAVQVYSDYGRLRYALAYVSAPMYQGKPVSLLDGTEVRGLEYAFSSDVSMICRGTVGEGVPLPTTYMSRYPVPSVMGPLHYGVTVGDHKDMGVPEGPDTYRSGSPDFQVMEEYGSDGCHIDIGYGCDGILSPGRGNSVYVGDKCRSVLLGCNGDTDFRYIRESFVMVGRGRVQNVEGSILSAANVMANGSLTRSIVTGQADMDILGRTRIGSASALPSGLGLTLTGVNDGVLFAPYMVQPTAKVCVIGMGRGSVVGEVTDGMNLMPLGVADASAPSLVDDRLVTAKEMRAAANAASRYSETVDLVANEWKSVRHGLTRADVLVQTWFGGELVISDVRQTDEDTIELRSTQDFVGLRVVVL